MDAALRQEYQFVAAAVDKVSILVLMDAALRLSVRLCTMCQLRVSILVLMDAALRHDRWVV